MSIEVLTVSALIEILTSLPNKNIPVLIGRKGANGLYTSGVIKTGTARLDDDLEVFCLQMFEGTAININ